jgi:hypothetical protein
VSQPEPEGPEKRQFREEAIIIKGKIDVLQAQQEERQKKDQEYKDRQLKFNRTLTVSTVGLLVMSVLANIISAYMAHATKESADAAKSAANVANQTLRMTQRSYVDLTDWVLTKHPTEDSPDVTFKFTNTGHSPATLIQADYGAHTGRPLPVAPRYAFNRAFNNHQLHPRRSLSSTMAISNIRHETLLALKPEFWFFVRAIYSDQFGQHKTCSLVMYEHDRARLAIYTEAPQYNCGD